MVNVVYMFISAICILSGTVWLSLVDLVLTSVNSGFTGVSMAGATRGFPRDLRASGPGRDILIVWYQSLSKKLS